MKLFISYARVDRELVEKLHYLLENVNKPRNDVFYDRELTGGDRWWDHILDEIEQCDVFVFALSPESTASLACQTELQYAVDLNKPILPVLLRDAKLPMGTVIESTHYADGRDLESQQTALAIAQALSRIREHINNGRFPSPNVAPERPEFPDPLKQIRVVLQDVDGSYSVNEKLAAVIELRQLAIANRKLLDEANDLLKAVEVNDHQPRVVSDEARSARATLEVPVVKVEVDSEPLYKASPSSVGQTREVQFSTFHSTEVPAERKYELLVYAHREDIYAQVEANAQKFRGDLGGQSTKAKTSKIAVNIKLDTPITVIPECEQLKFEPRTLTKIWRGDWSRFNFEYYPSSELIDETLFIRVSIQVASIEIAHINCAVEILPAKMGDNANQLVLAQSKNKSETVTPYQRIFISYSRLDDKVVRACKMAHTAIGNDVFLDVDDLRAGEDWRAALARAIDGADIFQLFWSDHSANSEYCRYEWEYALKFRCHQETNCEGFIRPVYWHKPMPSPPPELSRINFRFVSFDGEEQNSLSESTKFVRQLIYSVRKIFNP